MPEEPQGTRQENRLDGWRHWMAPLDGVGIRATRSETSRAPSPSGRRLGKGRGNQVGPAHRGMSGPGSHVRARLTFHAPLREHERADE